MFFTFLFDLIPKAEILAGEVGRPASRLDDCRFFLHHLQLKEL